VELLRKAGIQNVSADLIFALPESLERDWKSDVRRVLELGVQHVSLYGLTMEPHTPLGRWRERGEVAEAPEEAYEVDFLYADKALSESGFEHYEVSNYARAGKRSRHNSAYWSGVPYVGVGPSAHSFDGDRRTWNVAPYAEWVKRLVGGESVVEGGETLSAQNRNIERVYLGLRANRGLDCTDAELRVASSWVKEGWAEIVAGTVVLTALGWLRLDALATSLTLAGSD
jgi:oxygen-independent coproporphyrinogen-3 oxidase